MWMYGTGLVRWGTMCWSRSVVSRTLSAVALLSVMTGCGRQSAASQAPNREVASQLSSTTYVAAADPAAAASTTTIDPMASTPTSVAVVPPELAGDGVIPVSPVATADPVWLADNVPQAGSVFGNLKKDSFLDGSGPIVALTFDDGPTKWTPLITQILKDNLVGATFFQITNQSGARVALGRQMVADGFRIGSHSRSHAHLPTLTPEQQTAEIVGSADDLDAILGAGNTKCIRPPYGQMDLLTIDTITKRNLATALWNVDSEDWKKPGVPAIINRVLDTVRDRSVILMHDGGGDRSETAAALQWLIPSLRARGYNFVTIC